jgi:hypothetical protein
MALIFIALALENTHASFQLGVSPTPVRISLPSPNAASIEQQMTPTLTRTPTPIGPALLEAKSEANVRAKPDTEAEKVGTIRPGDVYPIIGRYYRWLQFQFPSAPNQTGWVFDELVTIRGDENTIKNLDPNALPTIDGSSVAATTTVESFVQSSGDLGTPRVNVTGEAPSTSENGGQPEGTLDVNNTTVFLPTFTYPPNIAAFVPTDAINAADINITPTPLPDGFSLATSREIPAILPIIILGGLGILGLVISSLRR